MSMIIDGTNGLTFNNATTQASAGSILQVVYGSTSTFVSSSSSTYADTGLSVSITPKFSTSKILVLVDHNGTNKDGSGSVYMGVRIVRGSTTILTYGTGEGLSSTTLVRFGSTSASYLDSPATTSATTYKTQFSSVGNNASVALQVDSAVSTMTLMEIAG
jgi:hypothetical protein